MPNFKETSGARRCFMKHHRLWGSERRKMTRAPLTLVSPSVIPLTAVMTYISLRILQRDPPPFYLLENIDYSKLHSGGLLI